MHLWIINDLTDNWWFNSATIIFIHCLRFASLVSISAPQTSPFWINHSMQRYKVCMENTFSLENAPWKTTQSTFKRLIHLLVDNKRLVALSVSCIATLIPQVWSQSIWQLKGGRGPPCRAFCSAEEGKHENTGDETCFAWLKDERLKRGKVAWNTGLKEHFQHRTVPMLTQAPLSVVS